MPRRNRNLDPRTALIAPLLLINQELLYRILGIVLDANAAFIENLNRAQLFAGKDASGADITPDYTEFTTLVKAEKNQPSDRVTLRDTGAFYESIFSDVFENAFEIKADDPKTNELKAKYGPDILGLTTESKEKLTAHIRPQFVALIRAELGLR